MGPRDGMKCEIPGGKPWILPRIRHGENIEGVKVPPTGISASSVSGRRRWFTRIPVQPSGHPVGVDLFAPDQTRTRLPQYAHLFFADVVGCQCGVELIGFPLTAGHDLVEVLIRPSTCRRDGDLIRPVQPETYFRLAPGRNGDLVPP